MIRLKDRFKYSEFHRVFNFKDDLSMGRCFVLMNNIVSSVANVFVSGVFYTGFLAINGIDIVRVGIITFVPYIAWGFSIFSPVILSKFKKRRSVLIFNILFYYLTIIIATTIMPMIVKDYGQRTIWFGIFLFMGSLSNALVGSGAGAWHVNFLPGGNDRNVYFSYINLFNASAGTFVGIAAALVADSLAGSPRQAVVITALRFVAAGLLIINGLLLYGIPKEYPYIVPDKRPSVLDIIKIPLKTHKFLLTALIVMLWSCFANLNASTWTYYVLNTMKLGYTYIYIGSVVNAVCSFFMLRHWRKMINYYSWSSILLLTVFCHALLEFSIGFATIQTKWVFVTVAVIQGFISVGTNLVFANLFYINLPKGSFDVFIIFWNFAANMSVLAGSAFGTWFLSVVEPHAPWILFGLPFYGSQFLVWIKGALLLGLCLFIRKVTPRIQPDETCPYN
jgi:hypothetical protein